MKVFVKSESSDPLEFEFPNARLGEDQGIGLSETNEVKPWLSLVIPLYNEAESLSDLYSQIVGTLGEGEYEIIFVDDGSTDGSGMVLMGLLQKDPRVRVVQFARNFGKAEGLAAGFVESRGQVIVTLDADLQDDPSEIPRLVAALGEGYDLVSGWKVQRRDPLSKTIPSRIFNFVTASFMGIRLHDFNSGFKAYRRRVIEEIRIYGEQYRFIPALAYWRGFKVTELPVAHRPRRYGRSKYGLNRFLSGLLDLLTVLFLTRFQRKPLHLFGTLGLGCLLIGLLVNLYLTFQWLGGQSIGQRPLLQLGVLLMVMGIQFLSLGLLGEMVALSQVQDKGREHAYHILEPPFSSRSWDQLSKGMPKEGTPTGNTEDVFSASRRGQS